MAKEWDCNPYPCRLVELEDLPPSLLCDGVHLTREGYAELANRVAAGLLGTEPKALPLAEMPPRRTRSKPKRKIEVAWTEGVEVLRPE